MIYTQLMGCTGWYLDLIKISYSTTPNIAQNISSSNTRKLSAPSIPTHTSNTCNCHNPSLCPLNSKCLDSNIIYQCDVTTPTSTKAYIGLTSTQFKTRYNNHMHTMRNPSKRKTTALSNYIWDLKDTSTPFDLRWSIIARAQPYKAGQRDCRLCNEEAINILFAEYPLLNKKSELVTSCRHKIRRSFLHYNHTRPPNI